MGTFSHAIYDVALAEISVNWPCSKLTPHMADKRIAIECGLFCRDNSKFKIVLGTSIRAQQFSNVEVCHMHRKDCILTFKFMMWRSQKLVSDGPVLN